MKILADDDLGALLSLVGIDGYSDRLNVELPSSTIKADLIIRTPEGIAHVEFVKDYLPDLALRMLEYRLRLRRRHRTAPITQYVLALRDLPVPDHCDDIDPGQLTRAWTVVRVTELDPVVLLDHSTTAALAPLAHGTDRQRSDILIAAAELITAHTEPGRRDLLLGAAVTLASIVLPRHRIVTALQEATMPVPVRDTPLGRELLVEGRQEGRLAVLNLIVLLIRERRGEDPRTALLVGTAGWC